MRLHTIYRSAPDENKKGRPSFYSKDLALTSFLAALTQAPCGERVFVNDGVIPEPRRSRITSTGEVVTLPGVGNCRSYRACLGIVDSRAWSDDDIVYLVEDDYLHMPDALTQLAAAADALPEAGYFTLYDHPDYYRLTRHRLFMRRRLARRSIGPQDWQAVRSTCLTYGARVGALRRDSWVHYLCSRGPGPPHDYAIWAILNGGGVSYAVPRLMKPGVRPSSSRLAVAWCLPAFRPSRRELYAARPALATHLELNMLAPGRDWASAANHLRQGTRDLRATDTSPPAARH